MFSMLYLLTWPHNCFDLLSISPVNNFYTGEHFRPLTCEPGHAGEQTRLSQGQQPLCERGGGDDHLRGGKKKEKKSQLSNRIKLLSETLTGRGSNAMIFSAWLPFKYLLIIFLFFFFFLVKKDRKCPL